MASCSVKQVQGKILEVMMHIDRLCRGSNIDYYLMGGTALGAVRHGGFIPWDDDLDVFMTPDNYEKFKLIFLKNKDERFELQEWRLGDAELEYAKVRMNGTTFIEPNFKGDRHMHQGVYVDIMILHKCPKSLFKKYMLFLYSRYVVAMALAERNWKPKTRSQSLLLKLVNMLPKHFLANFCYRQIYKYDKKNLVDYEYCYFITKAKFKQAIFPKEIFAEPVDVPFENVKLLAPTDIKRYLEIRFGNYMKLPPEKDRVAAMHAEIVDLGKDYKEYLK